MKNKTNKSNFIEEKQSDRRAFIKKAGVASLGGLAVSALPMSTALAQSKKVVAIMPGVFMPKQGRPIVESMSGVKVENAPYVSPTDTLAKLMAPGNLLTKHNLATVGLIMIQLFTTPIKFLLMIHSLNLGGFYSPINIKAV